LSPALKLSLTLAGAVALLILGKNLLVVTRR